MPLTAFLICLLVVACRSADGPTAGTLLAAMHRATGTAVRPLQSMHAVARVTGPNGTFEADVRSTRGGATRLSLGAGFEAGIEGTMTWRCDTQGESRATDSVTRTVIRGHELHLLALAPETRLGQAEAGPIQAWNGDSAWPLAFRDELGAPVVLYLRTVDTLPVGLELVNHTGRGPREVRIALDGWVDHGGILLFEAARFIHGSDTFAYAYHTLTTNSVTAADLESRCRAGQR